MFAYLDGKINMLNPSTAYLDIGGIGYEIQLTLNTYEAIRDRKQCRLFTHLQIREDAWVLYGFATEAERESFRKLLAVSGVGAATARILLSSLTAAQLHTIIESGDSKALEKVKGIGAKTAQRIILELKGKLPDLSGGEKAIAGHNTKGADALNALLGLGIAKGVAESALKKAKSNLPEEDLYSVEDWIKTALKCL
ncbi:MAG TPA: Holliday junction branch migration protein RuvA [Edaphocola sp.]|nr:Holliday junction branch migration protein RuvA [Edaphocola sp.]